MFCPESSIIGNDITVKFCNTFVVFDQRRSFLELLGLLIIIDFELTKEDLVFILGQCACKPKKYIYYPDMK